MTSHRKNALRKTFSTGFEPVLNRYETGFKLVSNWFSADFKLVLS